MDDWNHPEVLLALDWFRNSNCSNAISAKLPHTGSSCPDIKCIHMSVPVRPGPMLWTSRRFKSGSKQKQKFEFKQIFCLYFASNIDSTYTLQHKKNT